MSSPTGVLFKLDNASLRHAEISVSFNDGKQRERCPKGVCLSVTLPRLALCEMGRNEDGEVRGCWFLGNSTWTLFPRM